MTTTNHAAYVAALSNHELLALHIAVQEELKDRGITRTAATTGELGEHLALRMYGGTLAPKVTKGRDLIDPGGRRLQVKTRVKNRSEGQLKVQLKSADGFDACLVLLLDPANLEPLMAREVSQKEIAAMLKPHLHISSFRSAGTDVLDRASEAWAALGRGE